MSEKNTENQVLVVDDSRVIRRAAVKILEKEFDVVEAEDGEDAWNTLAKNPKISVVFSDLGMPKMDGFELLQKIRNTSDPIIAKIPVIIITGAEESDGTKEKVIQLGATDFISKPFDSASLKSRASAHINYRNEVQTLEKAAALDKLTGLSTEASFLLQGEQALAYAKRHCTEMSVVRFDIEHFSEIFVKHGKDITEQILAKVALLINEGKRTEDIAARLGVARFALLLPSSDPGGAEVVVSRICQRIKRLKLKMGKDLFNIQFNTGITSPLLDGTEETFSDLVKQAESALKKAHILNHKKQGGGCFIRYEAGKVTDEVSQPLLNQPQLNPNIEINIEDILQQLSTDKSSISNTQLAAAMKKILPLIGYADGNLKLGLRKVMLHLNKRLNS